MGENGRPDLNQATGEALAQKFSDTVEENPHFSTYLLELLMDVIRYLASTLDVDFAVLAVMRWRDWQVEDFYESNSASISACSVRKKRRRIC